MEWSKKEWKRLKGKGSEFIMLRNVKYCFLKCVSTEREFVCVCQATKSNVVLSVGPSQCMKANKGLQ